LGNDQIRKIAKHSNRDRAAISQDLKKVELHVRENKNSKEAAAVLENKLIKNKKRMKT
jgi:predicted GIY-YIG superfamily endonuclease